jgi:putative membrane protein
MQGFVIRTVVTAIAVLLATELVSGIEIDSLVAGLVGGVVLAILNALIRPILYLLSAPFIVVTFGLFMVGINAFLLNVVAFFVKGFHVMGFWSAIWGALIISIVSGLLNLFISERGGVEIAVGSHRSRKIKHVN